ncbi:MAG: hypothetical protein DRR19_23365 [Candidatus Parabeggiatoa sp. nov. 1]|nr:MAG: hypothetical protein DRR19_23365 [Gammaproteobacteria bacterium]
MDSLVICVVRNQRKGERGKVKGERCSLQGERYFSVRYKVIDEIWFNQRNLSPFSFPLSPFPLKNLKKPTYHANYQRTKKCQANIFQ